MAPRIVARHLHCRLDRFGSGIAKIDALGKVARGDRRQLLRELGEKRIIEVRPGHMNERPGLTLDGAHHVRVAVTGGDHGDAGAEIEEGIAINILNEGPLPPIRHEWIIAKIGGRNKLLIQGQDFLCLRPGKGCLNVGQCLFHSISFLLAALKGPSGGAFGNTHQRRDQSLPKRLDRANSGQDRNPRLRIKCRGSARWSLRRK